MEESAQRRERLKAMRMEASQEAVTYNDGGEHSTDVSHGLSNPLLESSANPQGQVECFAQSFNYYTDPMAAFSANKRRGNANPQISHGNSSTPPRSNTSEMFQSPAFRPRVNHSPDQIMHQPQGQYANPNYAHRSNAPRGANFSSPSFQSGNIPGPSFDRTGASYHNHSPSPSPHFTTGSGRGSGQEYPSPGSHLSNPGRGGYPSPGPHHNSGPGRGGYPSPRPHFNSGLGRGGYPSPGPHFINSPGQGGYPSPGSHLGPGSGQGGFRSPSPSQGRGHWFGNSMSSGPGSGRGQWSGHGGRGRGRGGGAHNHVSAEDRPDLFYNKSMVEDPWKFLEPVIWKTHKKPWMPYSLSMKKPKVSESPKPQQSGNSSQPSLAEFLAASFNEVVSEEPNA